jgi:hypothetical protein
MNAHCKTWPFLVASVFFLAPALAEDSGRDSRILRQEVTTTLVLGSRTPEAESMASWLIEHAQSERGRQLLDRDRVGELRISHSATRDGPAPVFDSVPLHNPPAGNPGDSFTVGTCSEGVSQVWEFEWLASDDGGDWSSKSYATKLVAECPSAD